MRLTSIKLAGFKSFVDPTTVRFPGNLCAVVGPNGCGKSNIIDAVRWVMGESSAKQLRGEASTDVIFNGSTARKPTAQASIELLFDNSDGRIGGEYAQYAEINIKRQVNREAQSVYFLNGNRCRRRDIIDIFLGTGFGPRSYSIIEQGMISDLVEAKPDDLRAYLEEAAGISRYKERRRETENRIRHTRENLDRLNDVRTELDRQLKHLARQAQSAQRYQELKAEEHQRRTQLFTLRWQAMGAEIDAHEGRIRQQELDLEKASAGEQGLEADIDRTRSNYAEESERFNEIQGRYYAVGADVARLDEAIAGRETRERELADELAAMGERLASSEQEATTERDKQRELRLTVEGLQPQLAAAESDRADAQARLSEAEVGAGDVQQAWDRLAERLATHQSELDVCSSRIENAEQLLQRLTARRIVLEEEIPKTDPDAHSADVINLEAEVGRLTERADGLAARIAELSEQVDAGHDAVAAAEQQLADVQSEHQAESAELASLEAVQQAALGRRDNEAADWLNQAGMASNRRFAETVSVSPGWELAVETVLADALQAVVVDGLDHAAGQIAALERGNVMFVAPGSQVPAAPAGEAAWLAEKVQGSTDVSLLAGIHAAEDLSAALALRPRLRAGESVVTKAGEWVGPDWLRVSRGEALERGILEREQQLHERRERVAARAEVLARAQDTLADRRRSVRELELQRGVEQERRAEETRRLGTLRADAGARRVQMEALSTQRLRLQQEHEDLVSQIDAEESQLVALRERLTGLSATGDALVAERSAAITNREAVASAVADARQQLSEVTERAHGMRLESQRMDSQLESIKVGLERLQRERAELASRRERQEQSLSETRDPIPELKVEREEKLASRVAVEHELQGSRGKMEALETQLGELDQQRSGAQRAVDAAREALQEQRMNWQVLRTQRGAVADQVNELGEQVELQVAQLPEEANVDEWQSELERIERRITRLGPINLAAIEEFDQQSERKVYLDAQNADLEAALETLETAIRKIDRETRTRFKDTYEQVNSKLGELFPKVFGGGHAYLEMTEDDLLNAGITLMARPPGKRNSSIHLLSGGEKALTAVALIMSIFQLNPSPVCMLDEVDAPLDDANVVRYSQLIKEMSTETQFIFITHNKVTMEMADQLMGVTMQEAGVSRLVSVDVEHAVDLAGAS